MNGLLYPDSPALRVGPALLLCLLVQLSLTSVANVGADMMNGSSLRLSQRSVDDPIQSPPTAPIASFTTSPSDHAKVNETVLLDAGGSWDPDGQVVQYNWDFSDGVRENVTEANAAHRFSTPGNFDVLRVVDDDRLLSEPATKTLNILIPPVAYFLFSKENFPPSMVVFNASMSYDPDGSILCYIWDFDDGSSPVEVNVPFVTHGFPLGGFNVTLTVVDNDGLRGSYTGLIRHFADASPNNVPYQTLAVVVVSAAGLAGLVFLARRRRQSEGQHGLRD